MRKISSILPANSRLTTVDLTDGPTRRPGSYDALAVSKKPSAVQRLQGSQGLALDKVTLSSEAQKAHIENSTESAGEIIQKVQKTTEPKITKS